MNLNLRVTTNGVEMTLRVSAGASRENVLGEYAGALKISVTAAPEKGKANKAIISFLARVLDIPKNALTIVKGETAQDKVVLINGITTEEINNRCQSALKK